MPHSERRAREGMTGDEDLYYYADGERITLELDAKHVGLDLDRVSSKALRQELEVLEPNLEHLRRNVYLADTDDLTESLIDELRKAGALQPVFAYSEGLLVALPEVRVEVEEPGKRSSLESLLKKKSTGADVVRDQGERVTIRPKTGSGLDALRLANLVTETVDPDLSQVRFLRYLRKPGRR